MRILKGHRGPVRAVAYAPDDGETLASLGGEGAVLLWNLPRGASWARFPCEAAARADLLFSPDGNRLIVSLGYARVLDVVGERWAGALTLDGPGYQALAFAPDGQALAGGQAAPRARADGWLRVFQWLPAAPPPRASWYEGSYCQPWEAIRLEGDVTELAWSPDGRTLAVAHAGQKVALWLFESEGLGLLAPRRRRTFSLSGVRFTYPREPGPLSLRKFWRVSKPIAGIAFVPGADLLLAVAAGPAVELWDADKGKRCQVLKGHKGAVRALAVSPDGRRLLTGGLDGAVRLWDAATGQQRQAFDWGLGAINALAFAPDGMTAAAGGDKPDIVIWDVDEG